MRSVDGLPNDPALRAFKQGCCCLVGSAGVMDTVTARQLAVLLIVYTERHEYPMTVRALADRLQIGRSVICRALTALEDRRLVGRTPDPEDARSILVNTTGAGTRLLETLRVTLKGASAKPAAVKARATKKRSLPNRRAA